MTKLTTLEYMLIRSAEYFEKYFPKSKVSGNYVISRQSKTGYIKRISPSIRHRLVDLGDLLNTKEYKTQVLRFKTILDNLPHCRNNAFYNNIETLEVEDIVEDQVQEGIRRLGGYRAYNNKIEVVTPTLESLSVKKSNLDAMKRVTFNHELIHMATTYKRGNITTTGFKNSYNTFGFGEAINEGYTEIINARYFSSPEDIIESKSNSYLYEQRYAYLIETLVGRKKMEELFFDADLVGLVEEMSKYIPLGRIQQIMMELEVTNLSLDKNTTFRNNLYVEMANAILEKNKKRLERHEITKKEYDLEYLQTTLLMKGLRLEEYSPGLYRMREMYRNRGLALTEDNLDLLLRTHNNMTSHMTPFTTADTDASSTDVVMLAAFINKQQFTEHKDLSNCDIVLDSSNNFQVVEKKEITTEEMLDELFNFNNPKPSQVATQKK